MRQAMTSIATDGRPADHRDECRIRIAAAGDIHYGEREDDRERAVAAFGALEGRADLILIAGDLTTHGEPEQGQIVADAVRDLGIPVIAVLGNHDWHVDRADELTAVLEEAGIVVLDRGHHVLDICDSEVGIVGAKGFVGGFPGSHLPDFGEPLLRGAGVLEVGRRTRAHPVTGVPIPVEVRGLTRPTCLSSRGGRTIACTGN
jgi:hypothetical protein